MCKEYRFKYAWIYIPTWVHGSSLICAGSAAANNSWWGLAFFLVCASLIDVFFDVTRPHRKD